MIKYFPVILLTKFTVFVSCQMKNNTDVQKNPTERYCGYEMSMDESNEIAMQTFGDSNPFLTKNSSETFLEIYDTLKNQVDSTIVYELTLVNLKPDEIWLDLKVPQESRENIEKLGCIIMHSNFSSLVPKQIKITIFDWIKSYDNRRTEHIITRIKKVN